MQHAALASTQSSASWSGLSVLGVIDLARWGPMACMAAQNVSMAPGAAPPGSWADRIVCHSAARAHGWRYCLVRERIECRWFERPSLRTGAKPNICLFFTPLVLQRGCCIRRFRSCCRERGRLSSWNSNSIPASPGESHRDTRPARLPANSESAPRPCPFRAFVRRRVLCRARSSGWGSRERWPAMRWLRFLKIFLKRLS